MPAYADVCGWPRTGVGTPRDVDYAREKGSDFDFNYEFNVSSRLTGIYIHIHIYSYIQNVYIFNVSSRITGSQFTCFTYI